MTHYLIVSLSSHQYPLLGKILRTYLQSIYQDYKITYCMWSILSSWNWYPNAVSLLTPGRKKESLCCNKAKRLNNARDSSGFIRAPGGRNTDKCRRQAKEYKIQITPASSIRIKFRGYYMWPDHFAGGTWNLIIAFKCGEKHRNIHPVLTLLLEKGGGVEERSLCLVLWKETKNCYLQFVASFFI